jgi:phenylpropionate dioxygenase-like ring-hydroxylating dioxygenase large terminal subunit
VVVIDDLDIPALGPGAAIPPRARLVTAEVAEHDGSIFVHPDPSARPTSARPRVTRARSDEPA